MTGIRGFVVDWEASRSERGTLAALDGGLRWSVERRVGRAPLGLGGAGLSGATFVCRDLCGALALRVELDPAWLRPVRGRALDGAGAVLARLGVARGLRGGLRVEGAAGWVEVRAPWRGLAFPAGSRPPCALELAGGARGAIEAVTVGGRRAVRSWVPAAAAEALTALVLIATLAADTLYLAPSRGPLGG
ncbi:MAG: hypothetical protein IT376_02345 [Polyangiaceae bacterium]|nr:hypothetical protein [Polyangiaceae bacterium]